MYSTECIYKKEMWIYLKTKKQEENMGNSMQTVKLLKP